MRHFLLTVLIGVVSGSLTAFADESDWTRFDRQAATYRAQIRAASAGQNLPLSRWAKHETQNFSIWTLNARLRADDLATVCESLRHWLATTWLDNTPRDWTPRCDIVIHPTLASYVATLGPGSEASNGCATIRLDSGRVVSRRIDLRSDDLERLASALPHELTHVVLADAFPSQQIPRWLDEGAAVLVEAPEKQARIETDWRLTAAQGNAFSLHELVTTTTQPPSHRAGAFYGESAALVRYLGIRGSLADVVRFGQVAIESSYSRACTQHYGAASISGLEREWLKHRPPTGGQPVSPLPSRR